MGSKIVIFYCNQNCNINRNKKPVLNFPYPRKITSLLGKVFRKTFSVKSTNKQTNKLSMKVSLKEYTAGL